MPGEFPRGVEIVTSAVVVTASQRAQPSGEGVSKTSATKFLPVVTSTATTAPDQSTALSDSIPNSTSTTPSKTARRPKADGVSGGGPTTPSTSSAPLRRPPSEESPTRGNRSGRHQRSSQAVKPEPHDILRHPLHHTAEADRPSSGQYSVSGNRLAIFHDISDIYDNTLKAFRAAATTHDTQSGEEIPVSGVVGNPERVRKDSAVSTVTNDAALTDDGGGGNNTSDSALPRPLSTGDNGCGLNEEGEDSEEEEGDQDQVGPQLVHFVPVELLLTAES